MGGGLIKSMWQLIINGTEQIPKQQQWEWSDMIGMAPFDSDRQNANSQSIHNIREVVRTEPTTAAASKQHEVEFQ